MQERRVGLSEEGRTQRLLNRNSRKQEAERLRWQGKPLKPWFPFGKRAPGEYLIEQKQAAEERRANAEALKADRKRQERTRMMDRKRQARRRAKLKARVN